MSTYELDADDLVIESKAMHIDEVISENSQDGLLEFYQLLHMSSTSPEELKAKFEDVVAHVVRDVQQQKQDTAHLLRNFQREKESYAAQLQVLELESEGQAAEVERRIRQEMEDKMRGEKDLLTIQMNERIVEIEQNIQRVENLGARESQNDLYSKVEQLSEQNQKLLETVMSAQTTASLYKSQLAAIKATQEQKENEIQEKERSLLDTCREHQQLHVQVTQLSEVNRQLHDTNDELVSVLEQTRPAPTPARKQMVTTATSIAYSLPRPPSSGATTPCSCHLDEDIADRHQTATQQTSGADSGHDTRHTDDRYDLPEELLFKMKKFRESLLENAPVPRAPLKSDCSMDVISLSSSNSSSFISDNQHISASRLTASQVTIDPDRIYKIVLAGDAAVGKSSLILRLCQNRFAAGIPATLGVDFHTKTIIVDDRQFALQLWDTAGQERFRAIAKSYFRRADGVMLLYDVTCERSFRSVCEWLELISEATDVHVPVLVCANKVDAREDHRQFGGKTVSRGDGERLAKEYHTLFMETSAKDGTGIRDAIVDLVRMMRVNEDIAIRSAALQLHLTKSPPKSSCRPRCIE